MSKNYTHLISVVQLADLLSNKNQDKNKVILLDASIPPVGGAKKPTKCWPNTSIVGAKRFELVKDFSDANNPLPHSFPSEQQFNQQAQRLSIDQESQIIIYDDLGVFSSARAWWMFKAMGHKNVAVLNGGLPQWLAHKSTVSAKTKEELSLKAGNFNGAFISSYFCSCSDVKEALENKHKTVLDARGYGRFSGTEKEPRAGMRSGHMPGALNLPYKSLLSEGCFLPSEQLKNLYTSLIEVNHNPQSLIMSCGSGVTACILALGAELCGYSNITVYDGSWSEWGKLTQLPVVTE